MPRENRRGVARRAGRHVQGECECGNHGDKNEWQGLATLRGDQEAKRETSRHHPGDHGAKFRRHEGFKRDWMAALEERHPWNIEPNIARTKRRQGSNPKGQQAKDKGQHFLHEASRGAGLCGRLVLRACAKRGEYTRQHGRKRSPEDERLVACRKTQQKAHKRGRYARRLACMQRRDDERGSNHGAARDGRFGLPGWRQQRAEHGHGGDRRDEALGPRTERRIVRSAPECERPREPSRHIKRESTAQSRRECSHQRRSARARPDRKKHGRSGQEHVERSKRPGVSRAHGSHEIGIVGGAPIRSGAIGGRRGGKEGCERS